MLACLCAAFVLFVALMPCVASVLRGEAPRHLLGMAALAVLEAALFASLARTFEDRVCYDVEIATELSSTGIELVVEVTAGGAIGALVER